MTPVPPEGNPEIEAVKVGIDPKFLLNTPLSRLYATFPEERNAYMSMKMRCENPKNPRYRGLKRQGIHNEYSSFRQFLWYMGAIPEAKKGEEPYRLCRLSMYHNYGPKTCFWSQWATGKEVRSPKGSKPWKKFDRLIERAGILEERL